MWWIHDTSRGTWAMATPAAASSSHCGMPPGAEDGRPSEALLGGKVWRGEADDRAMLRCETADGRAGGRRLDASIRLCCG